jgi:hypothetical protein
MDTDQLSPKYATLHVSSFLYLTSSEKGTGGGTVG